MTTTVDPRLEPGPYCDLDGENWWVPVSQIPNRMKAAAEVRGYIDSELVVRYDGLQRGVALDMEHEGGCIEGFEEGDPDPPCIVRADCWTFSADEPSGGTIRARQRVPKPAPIVPSPVAPTVELGL